MGSAEENLDVRVLGELHQIVTAINNNYGMQLIARFNAREERVRASRRLFHAKSMGEVPSDAELPSDLFSDIPLPHPDTLKHVLAYARRLATKAKKASPYVQKAVKNLENFVGSFAQVPMPLIEREIDATTDLMSLLVCCQQNAPTYLQGNGVDGCISALVRAQTEKSSIDGRIETARITGEPISGYVQLQEGMASYLSLCEHCPFQEFRDLHEQGDI